MRQWTREEKYRNLKDPQELKELYEKVSASVWRQKFHNQAVTGLMNDPNGFVWHDNRWHLFYAVHGVARSRTQLSNFTFTFHFHALEKEMATHSSVLAWRIPGTRELGGLPSMGSWTLGQLGADPHGP